MNLFLKAAGCALLCIAFGSFASAQDSPPEWRGIVPCISEFGEVARVLGPGEVLPDSSLQSYLVDGDRVTIHFQRVDSGAVVRKIEVFPRERISLRQYEKNIKNFRKEYLETVVNSGEHGLYSAVLRNWSKGFEVWIQKDDRGRKLVEKFGYFHPSWDCSKVVQAKSKY